MPKDWSKLALVIEDEDRHWREFREWAATKIGKPGAQFSQIVSRLRVRGVCLRDLADFLDNA